MSNDLTIIVVIAALFIVMGRLDSLSKQLAAVSAEIKAKLAPNEERKREVLSEWKATQKVSARDRRQSWIVSGIVVVLALAAMIYSHK